MIGHPTVLTFYIKLAMCILVIHCFPACAPSFNSVYRCSGFRVNGNELTQVFENIDCSGITYFITPEGRQTDYEYDRNGYYFGSGFFKKKIPNLDSQRNYYFLPFDTTEYWLAVKTKKAFLTQYRRGNPEEISIFSETEGLLHSFDAMQNKIIFDRRWHLLYVMTAEKRLKAFKVDGSRGFQETNVSEDAKLHFEAASELGMSFEDGWSGLSFAQIREKLSKKATIPAIKPIRYLVYLDEIGRLEYSGFTSNGTTIDEFIYTNLEDNQSKTYRTTGVINELNTVIANGKIWHYVLVHNSCLVSIEIRSIPL